MKAHKIAHEKNASLESSRSVAEGVGMKGEGKTLFPPQLVQVPAQLQQAGVVQRVGDFDFSYDDSSADDYDDHKDGSGIIGRYPKLGDLTGETKSKYEAKLKDSKFRENIYYAPVRKKPKLRGLGKGKARRHHLRMKSGLSGVSYMDEKIRLIKKSRRMSMLGRDDSLRAFGTKGKLEKDLVLRQIVMDYLKYNQQELIRTKGRSKSVIQLAPKTITLRAGGGVHQFDYTRGPNNNIDFSNNTATGNYDPVDHGTQVDLETGSAVAGWGMTKSGVLVDIAPNGKRSQHFSIADRIDPAAAAQRTGGWTWHHLDTQYDMVLVDSNVHNPGYGGFFHWGGMAFWT